MGGKEGEGGGALLTGMLTMTFHTQSNPSRLARNSLQSSSNPPTFFPILPSCSFLPHSMAVPLSPALGLTSSLASRFNLYAGICFLPGARTHFDRQSLATSPSPLHLKPCRL